MSAHDRIKRLIDDGPGVLLDGGVGSELVSRGVRWRGHGLRTDPRQVQKLHEEYINAGADLIRTNTFQLNPRIYLNVFRSPEHMRHIGAPGLETRARDLTAKAVEMALAAREAAGRDVAIAGVMSPLEHCFRPDLAPDEEVALAEHAEIAGWLAEAGVDLLLLESMNTISEARAAAAAASDTGLPVWASFVTGPEGEILSGETLSEGARALDSAGAEVLMVNCALPNAIPSAVTKLQEGFDGPVGAYGHAGRFDPPSWKFEFHPKFTANDEWPPDRYSEAAQAWLALGAQVIGGCCGTRPDHTRALREVL